MAFVSATVLYTVELLEHILIDVGAPESPATPSANIHDLFVLQRVNKTFNKTIGTSIHLRRMMLLACGEPESDTTASGIEFLFSGKISTLPHHPALPCAHFPVRLNPRGIMTRIIDIELLQRGNSWDCLCVTSNRGPPIESAAALDDEQNTVSRVNTSRQNHRSPNASWRKMLATSRPQNLALLVEMYPKDGDQEGRYGAVVELGETATLGEVYDEFEAVGKLAIAEHDRIREQYKEYLGVLMRATSLFGRPNKAWAMEAEELAKEHAKLEDCGNKSGKCTFCFADYYVRDYKESQARALALEYEQGN